MFNTGEKPGVGSYQCQRCGQVVDLDNDSDRLPPCPNCHGTEWIPFG